VFQLIICISHFGFLVVVLFCFFVSNRDARFQMKQMR